MRLGGAQESRLGRVAPDLPGAPQIRKRGRGGRPLFKLTGTAGVRPIFKLMRMSPYLSLCHQSPQLPASSGIEC